MSANGFIRRCEGESGQAVGAKHLLVAQGGGKSHQIATGSIGDADRWRGPTKLGRSNEPPRSS
jgi:hypothetical protein